MADDTNLRDQHQPKKIIINPDVVNKVTADQNQLADDPNLLKNILSILFVSFFLLSAFVGAYWLKNNYLFF